VDFDSRAECPESHDLIDERLQALESLAGIADDPVSRAPMSRGVEN
jgi:hypothetical protein